MAPVSAGGGQFGHPKHRRNHHRLGNGFREPFPARPRYLGAAAIDHYRGPFRKEDPVCTRLKFRIDNRHSDLQNRLRTFPGHNTDAVRQSIVVTNINIHFLEWSGIGLFGLGTDTKALFPLSYPQSRRVPGRSLFADAPCRFQRQERTRQRAACHLLRRQSPPYRTPCIA